MIDAKTYFVYDDKYKNITKCVTINNIYNKLKQLKSNTFFIYKLKNMFLIVAVLSCGQ